MFSWMHFPLFMVVLAMLITQIVKGPIHRLKTIISATQTFPQVKARQETSPQTLPLQSHVMLIGGDNSSS